MKQEELRQMIKESVQEAINEGLGDSTFTFLKLLIEMPNSPPPRDVWLEIKQAAHVALQGYVRSHIPGRNE